MSHSDLTSDHVSPRSLERNSPPGIVPAQSTFGSSAPPASSVQTCCSFQSGPVAFSGCGGYVGVACSSHVLPWSFERLIFTPKWPRLREAYSVPSRGSSSTAVTGSPRKLGSPIDHRPF
jgi:hypothetical protein